MWRLLALLMIPLSLALHWMGAPAYAVFGAGAVAVAILADWIRQATEQIASRSGGAVGGLLNVSFGSVAELVLALFVLSEGHTEVVQAQITGSIIGTSLLGLGLAILAGGANRSSQRFNSARIGLQSSLLFLVVVALVLPAVFDATERGRDPAGTGALDERLSIGVSVVLLLLYIGNLVYTLITHHDVFSREEEEEEGSEQPHWGCARALTVLLAATVAVALEAELVSGALEQTAETLGLTPAFIGVVALALVGTFSDLLGAVVFARQDRMNLVFALCIGSAIQVALVVAPLLVLLSWTLGHPMNLVFGRLDLFAIAGTAIIVRAIAADGETTWFEGLLLVGVYVLLALAFYFVGPA